MPGAAEQIARVCTGHDYGTPGKPAIGWDDPAVKDALVSALVNDANAVVAAFAGADWTSGGCALALLALVAGQDVEPPRQRRDRRAVADRPQVAAERVISAPTPSPAHPQVAAGPPRRLPRACGRRAGHRDHHR